jgi:hypothetical protein
MIVPVRITLATTDGLTTTFAMDLIGDAPAENYPINLPSVQWPHAAGEPNLPTPISSDAAWGEPGFAALAFSFIGHRFLGRLHHPERGLGVWPTPCGGQLQVAPTEVVLGQSSSVASVMDAVTSRRLVDSEGGMPDVTVKLSLQDPTACYDVRGTYHVDLHITVETDGASFDATANAYGSNFDGASELALWEDVCGDVSASPKWAGLFDADAQRTICIDGSVLRDTKGLAIAAEISTLDSTTEGFRIGWTYGEAP